MVVDPKKERPSLQMNKKEVPLAQTSKEVIINLKPHESPTSSSVSADNNVSELTLKAVPPPQTQINKLLLKQNSDQVSTPQMSKERPSSIHRRIFSDGTAQPNDVISGTLNHNRDHEDVSEVDTGNIADGVRDRSMGSRYSVDTPIAKLDMIGTGEGNSTSSSITGLLTPKAHSQKLPRPLGTLPPQTSEDVNSFKTTSSTITLPGNTGVFPHTNCMFEATGLSLEELVGRERVGATPILASEDVASHGDQHLGRLDCSLHSLLFDRGGLLKHRTEWERGRISAMSVKIVMVFSEVKQLKEKALDAVPVLQQLLSYLSHLTAESSDSTRWYLIQQAKCERRLGAVLKSAKGYHGAETHVRNYLAALKRLEVDTTESDWSSGLALLASVLSLLKRTSEAIDTDKRALELATTFTRR